MKFKLGELFCGPGGMGWGAKKAYIEDEFGKSYSIEHTWANDIDEWACETYRKNIIPDNPEKVICGPIEECIESLGEVNALAFGFPCNDFSIVGKKKGFDGKYGPLYSYGVRVLEKYNPYWFVAENVGGLRSANDGNAFQQILYELTEAGKFGYELTPHLYKFEEYGVPQTRHRIIIVGFRKDLGKRFEVPAPTHKGNFVTAKEAIEIPTIDDDAPNHVYTRHTSRVIQMLSHIPPGENAWYEDLPGHLQLNVKGARMSNIYRRLEADKPSYTVTGSGGGGTHVYHYNEPRALTNRERARLQTFDDDFIFYGPKEMVRKQIGMAVPPRAAKQIFEAVMKSYAGIKYNSIESRWWSNVTTDFDEEVLEALNS